MNDVKEVLVHWAAGEGIRQIARQLGYDRLTVRRYVETAQRMGLQREVQYSEAGWDELAMATRERIAKQRPPGAVAEEVARYHSYLDQRVGDVRLSVLHQRLRDEQDLHASWGVFYRYVARHWPERLERQVKATVRLPDPPAGAEAQVDFFYVRRWQGPDGVSHRLSALLLTLSNSRHCYLYPTIREDAITWQEGHVAAFSFWQGAPHRLIPDYVARNIIRVLLPDALCCRTSRARLNLAWFVGVSGRAAAIGDT